MTAILLVSCCLLLVGCGQGTETENGPVEHSDPIDPRSGDPASGCIMINGQETIQIGNTPVDIFVPKGNIRGDLLLLPPWGRSKSEWCAVMKVCKKARRLGYRLIMPEMGKSIYSQGYYPETRPDWRQSPPLPWVSDTLIPNLQEKYCILLDGKRNFVTGIATGARGAVLLAIRKPRLFTAISAISGDYEPEQMPADNLYRGIFGSYERFPERWKGPECPLCQADQLKTPIFLAHGRSDKIVPYQQTRGFAEALKAKNPDLKMELDLANDMDHNLRFWAYAISESMDFFAHFQEDKGAENDL